MTPGFIDTHVHLTMDAANLARQPLHLLWPRQLGGLSLAREYMSYGFATLRETSAALIQNGRRLTFAMQTNAGPWGRTAATDASDRPAAAPRSLGYLVALAIFSGITGMNGSATMKMWRRASSGSN